LLQGVFLHSFEPWILELIAQGYRVISVELSNHGLSESFSDSTVSLKRYAAVVKAVLENFKVNTVTIGGNSMEGRVCWYFSGEYHGKNSFEVHGIIIIDAIFPAPKSNTAGPNGMLDTLLSSSIGKI
jgi:pimeloyl-ACP methyl ester carboxylesterase